MSVPLPNPSVPCSCPCVCAASLLPSAHLSLMPLGAPLLLQPAAATHTQTQSQLSSITPAAAAVTVAITNDDDAPSGPVSGRKRSRTTAVADRPVDQSESPAAFLQLLHSDPALCAAIMQLAQRHMPHLLCSLAAEGGQTPHPRPQPMVVAAVHDPTALSAVVALTAAVGSSAQSSPVQAESEEAKLVRIGRLRDQTLVTDTIAIVLSFLPARERLPLGRVGREWRSAVQQLALWANAGWRFYRFGVWCAFNAMDSHCPGCSPSLVPSWLRRRLGRVDCSSPHLRHLQSLAVISSFDAARRLDIGHGHCNRAPSSSVEDIRRALQPLRLLSLGVADLDPATDLTLLEALLGPVGVSGSGAMDSAPSPALAPLLSLWAPTLTDLRVSSNYHTDQSASGRLVESVGRLHWPALRSLSLNLPTRHNWPCIPVIAALLPSLLMRERMPLLQTLRIGYAYDCAAAIESFLAALPLISSSLTELDLEFEFQMTEAPADDWLPGFHLLPSLRVLRCNIDTEFPTGAAIARSIALAPKLEVLQLYTEHGASEVCEQLRLRCEAASGDGGGGGGGSGVGSGLGTDRIALRELLLGDCRLGAAELAALALLPHLEHLDGQIGVGSIGMLSELLQLRSLRLSFEDECTDAAIRQLSRLRLPHLQSLVIPYLAGSGTKVTIRNGVRHLLEIPSLTRLQLPWLSADQLHHLHLIHCASNPDGRRGPVIDTATTETPRSAGLFDVRR